MVSKNANITQVALDQPRLLILFTIQKDVMIMIYIGLIQMEQGRINIEIARMKMNVLLICALTEDVKMN